MKLRFKSNGELLGQALANRGLDSAKATALLEAIGEHMVNVSVPETFRAEGPGWPRSAWSAEKQGQDTGALLRSVTHDVEGNKLRVGTNLKYARKFQLGGVTKPKRAKALAIPLPHVPRAMRRPRRFGKRLFYVKPAKGGEPNDRGILAVEVGRGKRAEIKPMFVLRGSSTTKPRPFLVWKNEDIAMAQRTVLAAWAGR